MRERYGVTVLGALGFENAYALAMRSDRAAASAYRNDRRPGPARAAADVSAATSNFSSRPEWTALRQAYGLAFGQEKSFNPTFMYRATRRRQVDVISAFSSDGRLAGDHAGGAGRR